MNMRGSNRHNRRNHGACGHASVSSGDFPDRPSDADGLTFFTTAIVLFVASVGTPTDTVPS